MEIISHRGYWKESSEKNLPVAFERSFSLGFGTETDIRDFCKELVISHDIATESSIKAKQCFKLYNKFACKGVLAINIKADGLQQVLKSHIDEYKIKNYFVFDMSVPDTIGYIKAGINFFTRQSEYEPIPAFYSECNGVWLDSFSDRWFTADLIKEHINQEKKVAIVSSELHKRDHLALWKYLREEKIHLIEQVIICTDLPEDAMTYFQNYE